MNEKSFKFIYQLVLITLGTALMSIAINSFYSPNDLVTGGVTGISIMVRELTKNSSFPIELWMTNVILNVPLFIVAIILKGKKFMIKTIYATAHLTVALYYTSFIPIFESDLIISALFGGSLMGIGLGLVFRCFATTGGSDTAASLIHSFLLKHIDISKILFVLDAAVVCAGFFLFGFEKAMYAIIAVFVTSKAVDYVLEGLSFAKAAFIISEKDTEIADVLLHQINRGATALTGHGMYTGQPKNVVLCVVSKKEIVKLKEIVKKIDVNAFVIVADVREVLGLGFM